MPGASFDRNKVSCMWRLPQPLSAWNKCVKHSSDQLSLKRHLSLPKEEVSQHVSPLLNILPTMNTSEGASHARKTSTSI